MDTLNPQFSPLIPASFLFTQDKLDSKYLLHQGHKKMANNME